jgi:hypothetical protein
LVEKYWLDLFSKEKLLIKTNDYENKSLTFKFVKEKMA